MGDRRMAEIRTRDGSLYVYTHWAGHRLPEDAEAAIVAAGGRMDDEAYALRIIVDQITKPGRDEVTGYGLMLEPRAEDSYNGDVPSVVIDIPNRLLTVIGAGARRVPFAALVAV